MIPARPMVIPVKCRSCTDAAVKVPVVEVPIRDYPQPVRLVAGFGLCERHAAAFTMREWDDVADVTGKGGGWYEMVADQLRGRRKPASNPFPEDPSFKWEEWIIDPNWHAAAKDQCLVKFYSVAVLQGSRGMHQPLL